jgi:glutamate synthase (NADPH/NADH) large chain
MDEVIGRVDLLEPDPAVRPWKLPDGLDFDAILHVPELPFEGAPIRHTHGQDHGLDKALDNELVRRCEPALTKGDPVELDIPIRNINRTVGTILGHELSKKWGEDGLPDDTIKIHFTGSAGQSFGAFVPRGISMHLIGDANDYIGKGLSGGKIIVHPHPDSPFEAADNIVIGNVACYGATSGEAFFSGVAGERFCVRNSGVMTVVEGVGDHGCEYMTGGRVVILGNTGSNFAAGMSGGIAYVWDPDECLPVRTNHELVDLDRVDEEQYERELRALIELHRRYTNSARAAHVLDNWDTTLPQFVQVFPRDYKRALAGIEFSDQDY